MKRYILTGASGSGKTAILRQLELDGFSVVEEAATDVISAAQMRGVEEPWKAASFIDEIAMLQRDRQLRASYQPDKIQFHDRSAVCTAALAWYLGYTVSPVLGAELKRIGNEEQASHPNSCPKDLLGSGHCWTVPGCGCECSQRDLECRCVG